MDKKYDVKKILGQSIKNLRESRHLTQEEIIKATGLSKKTVSQLFSGKYYNYKLSTLETISKFFNCKIKDILIEVGN